MNSDSKSINEERLRYLIDAIADNAKHPQAPTYWGEMRDAMQELLRLRTAQPKGESGVTDDEACDKRDDGQHCNCWYDGEACCSCGAGSAADSVWQAYTRKGVIEVRKWTDADVHATRKTPYHAPSISDADTATADELPAIGYVARNPDNANDQWYIAPDYFVKNYALRSPAACAASQETAPKCETCDGDGAVEVKTHDSERFDQDCPICKGTGLRLDESKAQMTEVVEFLKHLTIRPSFHHDCDDYTRGYGDALAGIATQASGIFAKRLGEK